MYQVFNCLYNSKIYILVFYLFSTHKISNDCGQEKSRNPVTTCSFMRINGLRKDISISCSLIQCLFLWNLKKIHFRKSILCFIYTLQKKETESIQFFSLSPPSVVVLYYFLLCTDVCFTLMVPKFLLLKYSLQQFILLRYTMDL